MAATGKSAREDKPKRFRAPGKQVRVGSMRKKMEKEYGLPKGSVKIVNPSGKNTRKDAKKGTVARNWKRKS